MNDCAVEIPIKYSDIPSYELFACEPPNFLYHYTDYNGAAGIIESKSLRLTKLGYLNDTTELHHAINLFKSAAEIQTGKIENDEKRELLNFTKDQLESFRETNICIASFCESGDLLSQWRSYGNDGSGVAVKFDGKELKRIISNVDMNLWKCVYTERDHHKIIDGLLHIFLNSYDALQMNRKSETWEKTKYDLVGIFNTTFLRVAPIIKNGHFHEEKEWRIVTRSTSIRNDNWFPLISNNKVSQYYRLSLDSGTGKCESVGGLIVGPSSKQNLVEDTFSVLLDKSGYGFRSIEYSQIPYKR